jgi:hypothetical protein
MYTYLGCVYLPRQESILAAAADMHVVCWGRLFFLRILSLSHELSYNSLLLSLDDSSLASYLAAMMEKPLGCVSRVLPE